MFVKGRVARALLKCRALAASSQWVCVPLSRSRGGLHLATNWGMARPQHVPFTQAEDLVGQILHRRFAVLEARGPDRYRVFDMQSLQEMQVLMKPGGVDFVVLGALPPAAPGPKTTRTVPPPLPEEICARPPAPAQAVVPRKRVETHRFEAAWFARGAHFDESTPPGEVTDYATYQRDLEQLAESLPAEAVAHRPGFESGGRCERERWTVVAPIPLWEGC
jgi:hypothetical protein